MNNHPVLYVRHTLGRADLIGVAAGTSAGPRLVAAARALPKAAWMAVDFQGMDMVSASAARTALFTDLFVYLNDEHEALPVLMNLNEQSLDEVHFAAQALKLPVVVAQSILAGQPAGVRVFGELDQKQRQTLQVVAQLKDDAHAKAAHEATKDALNIGATAWNNRMSALAAMRLLQERKVGKTKYYSLTLKGLVNGN